MNQSEQKLEKADGQGKLSRPKRNRRRSESDWMHTMTLIAAGLSVLFAALVLGEFFGRARPALCLMFLLFSAVCLVMAVLFYHWKRAVDRENEIQEKSWKKGARR